MASNGSKHVAAGGESTGDTERLRVLLVDPNGGFRSTASALLERERISVESVADADDAPDREGSLDCVVVDPGARGDGALGRAARLSVRTPTVLVTGAPPCALSDVAWTVADGYVEKGRSKTFDALASTIRDVSRAGRS